MSDTSEIIYKDGKIISVSELKKDDVVTSVVSFDGEDPGLFINHKDCEIYSEYLMEIYVDLVNKKKQGHEFDSNALQQMVSLINMLQSPKKKDTPWKHYLFKSFRKCINKIKTRVPEVGILKGIGTYGK